MDAHLGLNEIRSPNLLFTVLIYWNSEFKKNFDAKFTITEAVQHSVFLVFHTFFRLLLAFVCIYTFPADIMLIEFAIQHITGSIKTENCLALHRGVSNEFCSFLADLVALSAGCFTCLNCLGRGGSVMPGWSHALKNLPLFLKTEFRSNGQVSDILILSLLANSSIPFAILRLWIS